MEHLNKAFWQACQSGNIEEAKRLQIAHPEIACCIRNFAPFRLALKKGHLDIAKWLQKIFPISVSSIRPNTLKKVIQLDNAVEILQWLDEIYVFQKPLEIDSNTKLDVVIWIVERFRKNPAHILEDTSEIPVIEWLIQKYGKDQLKSGVHTAFLRAIDPCNLALLKLIYSISPESIDKFAINDLCQHIHRNKIEYAEWVFSTFQYDKQTIEYVFRNCAFYSDDEVFVWAKSKVSLSEEKINNIYADVILFSENKEDRFKRHFPTAKLESLNFAFPCTNIEKAKWILKNHPSLFSVSYISARLPEFAMASANLPVVQLLTTYFDIGIEVMEKCYKKHMEQCSGYGPESSYKGYPVVKWLREVYDF